MHKLFYVSILPVFYLGLMTGLELLIDRQGPQQRLTKVAWDLCVLALGLGGHVFADPAAETLWGRDNAQMLRDGSFVVSLLCAVGIALLRRDGAISGKKAIFALILGGVAIGGPTWFMAKIAGVM